MKITLIGGMERLEPHYQREAKKAGHKLKVFSTYESGLTDRVGSCQAMVLFTSMVSHNARMHAMEAARLLGIPLLQCHSCGVCALRTCLAELAIGHKEIS